MRGTKYLSEVMENIELSKDENNLLLAPIGCGKTYYAIEVLMNNPGKKYLYLCDNNNLLKSFNLLPSPLSVLGS